MSTSADGSVNGKYRRPETHSADVSKKLSTNSCKNALQVGETDVLVDHQPFDLMEHRRVGHVGIAAIDPARGDQAQRRRLRPHRPDLHRRGVGAQQPP